MWHKIANLDAKLVNILQVSQTITFTVSFLPTEGFSSLHKPFPALGPLLQIRVPASNKGGLGLPPADSLELRTNPCLGTPGHRPWARQPVCSRVVWRRCMAALGRVSK